MAERATAPHDRSEPSARDASGLFTWAVRAGSLALASGLLLLFAGELVLERIVLPLVARFATGDGVVDADAVPILRRLLGVIRTAALVGGVGALAYAWLGRRVPTWLGPDGDTAGDATGDTCAAPLVNPAPSGMERLLVVTSVLLFTSLCVPHLDRGMSYDEIFTTVNFVQADSLWGTLSGYVVFNNHVAYSVVARFSGIALGEAEWALRLPALLLGAAAVWATWRLVRVLRGPQTAGLVCLLLALSPMAVAWSSSARGYSGLLLCAVLSTGLYRRALLLPCRRTRWMWIATGSLGAWFHLYMVFVIAAQLLHLLTCAAGRDGGAPIAHAFAGSRKLTARAFLGVWTAAPVLLGVTLLLYAPVAPKLLLAIADRPPGPFRPSFPLDAFAALSGLLPPLTPDTPVLTSSAAWLLVPVALLALAGWARLHKASRETARLALLSAGLPLLTVWLASPYDLYPRFLLFLLPFHLLLVAEGLQALGDGVQRVNTRTVSLLVVLIASAALAFTWRHTIRHDVPEEGIRDAALAMQADLGDDVLLCAIGGGAELFRYYVDGDVLVPETLDDFNQAAAGATQIRCAWRRTPWEPAAHTAIAQRLMRDGDTRRFGNVTLITAPR